MLRLRLRYWAAKGKQSERTDDTNRQKTRTAGRQRGKKDYRVTESNCTQNIT